MAEYFLITAKRGKTASVPRFVVDVIPSARARRFPPAWSSLPGSVAARWLCQPNSLVAGTKKSVTAWWA